MADQSLASLFAPDRAGQGVPPVTIGTITAWNNTTGANTVTANGITYRNLAILLPPTAPVDWYIVTDQVLLLATPGAPIILGVIKYAPPP